MNIVTYIKKYPVILGFLSFCYNIWFSPLLLRYYLWGGVKFNGSFLKRVKISIRGNSNIFIGPKTVMSRCVLIAHGDNSMISISGGATNIKNSMFIASQDCGRILIDSGFTAEGCEIRAHEGRTITIGSDCMFSSGIVMSTTDYHSILNISDNKRINKARNITIGNHVWLGRNIDILKGIDVADDVVVGAGSMVTKNLEESHAVYAGAPAKIIRTDVTWVRPIK